MLKISLRILLTTSLFHFSLLIFAQIPSAGMVSYYSFAGNGIDSTLNGYDGQVFGPTPITDRFARPNSAYSFDGLNDSILIPLPPSMLHDFTISFWEKSDRVLPMNIISFGNPCRDTVPPLGITVNDSVGISVSWQNCYPNKVSEEIVGFYTAIPELYTYSYWHHFVFTKKDTLLIFYIDNVPVDTAYTRQIVFSSNNLKVGGDGKYMYTGKLDDLYLYNRALDSAEISKLYYANDLFLNYGTNEDWVPGAQEIVSWVAGPNVSTVKLEYTLDGSTWNLIDTFPSWYQPYLFTIPDTNTANCFLRISDYFNPSISRTSEIFSISQYKWIKLTDHAAFDPRDGASAVVYKDIMWLVGGWNPLEPEKYPKATNNEVWFSTNGSDWHFVTNAPWAERHFSPVVEFKNKIWLIGGDNNSGYSQNDIWNSDNGVDWNLVTNEAPWKIRHGHYSLTFKDKIWVMGGVVPVLWGDEIDTIYNDVWNSNDGITWNRVLDKAPWSPRGLISGRAVFQDKIWVIGGGTYNEPRYYYNDVWNSSDGINWTLVTPSALWHPRQYQDIAVFDNKLWVIGGFDGQNNRRDVWYSSDGSSWTRLKGTPWDGRHASSVYVYKDALYLTAGNLWNDSWKLINGKTYSEHNTNSTSNLLNDFILYPNPFEDNFTIELQNKEPGTSLSIKLFDMLGQVIYENDSQIVATSIIHVHPGKLSSGVYILSINDGKKTITKKIIKIS